MAEQPDTRDSIDSLTLFELQQCRNCDGQFEGETCASCGTIHPPELIPTSVIRGLHSLFKNRLAGVSETGEERDMWIDSDGSINFGFNYQGERYNLALTRLP